MSSHGTDANTSQAPDQQTLDAASPAPPARARLLGWLLSNGLTALVAALAVVAVVGAVWTAKIMLAPRPKPVPVDPVARAMAALEAADYAEAQRWTQQFPPQEDPTGNPAAQAYVLGVLAARQARYADERSRWRLAKEAARWLGDARVRGFPAGHELASRLLLAESLLWAGEPMLARSLLHETLEAHPGEGARIRLLLAQACIQCTPPRYVEALAENQRVLSDSAVSPENRVAALLQRADILLRKGDTSAALQALAQVPAAGLASAEAAVLRARAWLAEAQKLKGQADAQEQMWQRLESAIEALRPVADGLPLELPTRQANFLLGLCLAEGGRTREALAQLDRTRMLFPGTADGVLADLEQADLLRRAGEADAAREAYLRVLQAWWQPGKFFHGWVTAAEVQRRVWDAYQAYLQAQQFDSAIRLAETMEPLFPSERQRLALAEAFRARGRHAGNQATGLADEKAMAVRQAALKDLRRAGALYAELAQMRFATRQYPEDLWEAASCLLEGHDYAEAARRFKEYLTHEVRQRQAPAMVGLAEALLALDRLDEAIATLRQCVAMYPRDMAVFRARILAAQALADKGQPDDARRLLEENLEGPSLTPASLEWRDSLFALGRLLYWQQQYEEAARRLDEAVRRYPDCPQALGARYLLAECSRQAARAEAKRLESERVENVRVVRYQKVRQLLSAAAKQFGEAQEALARQQEQRPLSPLEKAMLRNAVFAAGDVLYDLGRYDEAIRAYRQAIQRYQHGPEVLEAYLQTARAFRQLDQPQEAQAALQQARSVLARLKADSSFVQLTNYTAQQWAELLDQLTAAASP